MTAAKIFTVFIIFIGGFIAAAIGLSFLIFKTGLHIGSKTYSKISGKVIGNFKPVYYNGNQIPFERNVYKPLSFRVFFNVIMFTFTIIFGLAYINLLLQSFCDSYTGGIISNTISYVAYKELFSSNGTYFWKYYLDVLSFSFLYTVVIGLIFLLLNYIFTTQKLSKKKDFTVLFIIINLLINIVANVIISVLVNTVDSFENYGFKGGLLSLLILETLLQVYIILTYYRKLPYSIDDLAILDGVNRRTAFNKYFKRILKHLIFATILIPFMALPFSLMFSEIKIVGVNEPIGLISLFNIDNFNYYYVRFAAQGVICFTPGLIIYSFFAVHYYNLVNTHEHIEIKRKKKKESKCQN